MRACCDEAGHFGGLFGSQELLEDAHEEGWRTGGGDDEHAVEAGCEQQDGAGDESGEEDVSDDDQHGSFVEGLERGRAGVEDSGRALGLGEVLSLHELEVEIGVGGCRAERCAARGVERAQKLGCALAGDRLKHGEGVEDAGVEQGV